MKKSSMGLAGLSVVALAGTGLYAASQSSDPVVSEAAWSQYIDNGGGDDVRLIARFILDKNSPDCSKFSFSGDVGTTRVKAQTRVNHHPETFDVSVCQGVLDNKWSTVTIFDENNKAMEVKDIDGQGIPLKLRGPAYIGSQHPDKIKLISLGDSGCQERTDRSNEDCAPAQSNLHDLIDKAIAEKPDLYLHVGDYRYWQQGGWGNPVPDSWDYWKHDLFRPAQKLLMNAPWIMVRGNHESCKSDGPTYSGHGFNYFFEASDTINTHQCTDETDRYPNWTAIVPKGEKFPIQRIMVIDTASDAMDAPPGAKKTGKVAALKKNFIAAINNSKGKSVWWATHKPILSLEEYCNGNNSDPGCFSTRVNFEDALKDSGVKITDLCKSDASKCLPSLIMVGHEHFYQYIDFPNNDVPHTAIVGNGGVDKHTGTDIFTSPCTFSAFPEPFKGAKAKVEFSSNHGFTLWTRTEHSFNSEHVGWERKPIFSNGNEFALALQVDPCKF